MEYRNLELTIISADGLKDINLVGKMDLYAVACLVGHPKTKQKTGVDKNCGTNPKWNQTLKFTFDESSLASPPSGGGAGLTLLVQIMAEKFGPDKDIGEVSLNVFELFESSKTTEGSDNGGKNEKMADVKVADYQIQGKGKGTLKISYKFGEKFSKDTSDGKSKKTDESLMYPPSVNGGYGESGPSMPPPHHVAYPPGQGYGMGAPPPPQYLAYPPNQGYGPAGPYPPPEGYGAGGPPPPQPGYYPQQPPPQYGYPGYGTPPPQGYGGYYPPPQGGYAPPMGQPHGYDGYNQQVPEKKKKSSKMGLGLGVGLGAGLLGGMLIGDMVGDAGDAMGDAGDFDF